MTVVERQPREAADMLLIFLTLLLVDDPLIQKVHLFRCVKPMFSVWHDGQRGADPFRKSGHGWFACERIPFPV